MLPDGGISPRDTSPRCPLYVPYMAKSSSIFSLELRGKAVYTSHLSAEIAPNMSIQTLKESFQSKDCFRGLLQEAEGAIHAWCSKWESYASALKMLRCSNSNQKKVRSMWMTYCRLEAFLFGGDAWQLLGASPTSLYVRIHNIVSYVG